MPTYQGPRLTVGGDKPQSLRLKLLVCDVLYREFCWAVSQSINRVDLEFLPKGLHDIGAPKMLAQMQESIDRVDEAKYDAIGLGYGLCSNGLNGLQARSLPLIIPRAHDCITLFLGSKERYLDYFHNNPGVYFATSGWIERGGELGELTQQSIGHQSGMDKTYEELVEKYGEDNAKFLYEQLVDTTRNYHQFTYISMGIEPADYFETITREAAEKRNWSFQKIQGDINLIRQLVDGVWDEDKFLFVPPGKKVVAKYDEGIITAE